MQDGHTQWQKKGHYQGSFGNYSVMGFKFQNPDGEVGWHVTSWQTGFDPAHDFWVSGKTFYSMRIHCGGTPSNVIEIFSPIKSGIEQAERDALLKATGEWEKTNARA
jgi:hypothetical protein